ncbi:hypothetical protein AKO1_007778 [Acrasis kona]|uniref:Fungal lipase-like domain-containing protein n=1 Tax=Acrasis kona TaxID=1008807 RepID=A0AAW2YRE5_9EUKA
MAMMNFVLASLLSKCVQFIVVIWRKEQFMEITSKMANFAETLGCGFSRWLDLIFQLLLFLILEVMPLIAGAIYTIMYGGNVNIGFQAYLTFGTFASLAIVLLWWIGTTIESYKRVFMFFCSKKTVFSRLKIKDIDDAQLHAEKISEVDQIIEEASLEDPNAEEGTPIFSAKNLSTRDRSDSYVSQNYGSVTFTDNLKKEEDEEEFIDIKSVVTSPDSRTNDYDSTSIATGDDEDFFEIRVGSDRNGRPTLNKLDSAANVVDIEIERNLFVLVTYFCCVMPIGIPNYLKRKSSEFKRAKIYFRVSQLWIVLMVLVVIAGISIIGVFNQWKLYAVATVIVTCVLADLVMSRVLIIPYHRPSRKRFAHAWNVNIVQRYIALVEEVFYHSPSVIFRAMTMLCYLFLIIFTVSLLYGFNHSSIIFGPLAALSMIVSWLYIMRFNYLPMKNYLLRVTGFERLIVVHPRRRYLHNEKEHQGFRIASVVSFVMVSLTLEIAIMITVLVMTGWQSFLFFLALCFSVCFVVFKRFDVDAAEVMVVFFSIFLITVGGVFVLGTLSVQSGSVQKNYAQVGVHMNASSKPYPICGQSWYGYSAVDYGFIASLAYEGEPYFTMDLNTWFGNDLSVIYQYNSTVTFFDLYDAAKNLSIITVRGTDTPLDMIQDLDIWKETLLLQTASVVGPFVSFWPDQLTIGIIKWVSKLETMTMNAKVNGEDRFYYTVLDDYVRNISQYRQVIMVGHSLGGGLCKIVGSRYGIPAITFSAPGVVNSRDKFGISLDAINKWSVSIRPHVDLVSRIDKDGGMIQFVDCELTFDKCHSIVRTTRSLIESCGSDERGRWIEL